jgi:purine-binding chemotaxis protein CheW
LLALVFPLGPEAYALPLRGVREVVAAPALTALPTAPPAVMGLVNLRGDVLPVFDACRLVGSPFPGPVSHVMVVDTPAGPAGLAATGLPLIADLEPALEVGRAEWAGGVHTTDGRAVVMLDVQALLEQATAEA